MTTKNPVVTDAHADSAIASVTRSSGLIPVSTQIKTEADYPWQQWATEGWEYDPPPHDPNYSGYFSNLEERTIDDYPSAGGRGLEALDEERGFLYVITPMKTMNKWELKTFDVSKNPPAEVGTTDLLALTNAQGDTPQAMERQMFSGFGQPSCIDCAWSGFYCNIPPAQIDDGNGAHHYEGYTLVWNTDAGGNVVSGMPAGCHDPHDAGNPTSVTCSTVGNDCMKPVHIKRWLIDDMQVVNHKLVVQSIAGLNFFDLTNPAQPRFMFTKRSFRGTADGSDHVDHAFCEMTKNNKEYYFFPQDSRRIEVGLDGSNLPNNPLHSLGGIDVWVYDGNESATAAATHAELKKIDMTDPSYPIEAWKWEQTVPTYDYHIESLQQSPHACAIQGDKLIALDNIQDVEDGWANLGAPGHAVVDLSGIDSWPKWSAEQMATLVTANTDARDAMYPNGFPELPKPGVATFTAFHLGSRARGRIAANNPETGLFVVGDRSTHGLMLTGLTSTNVWNPYFYAGDTATFDDPTSWQVVPPISTVITQPLFYARAAFLGKKALVTLLDQSSKLAVLDVSNPGSPLQIFADDLALPAAHFLVDVVPDRTRQQFYVTINKGVAGTPYANMFRNLTSPYADTTDMTMVFERNFLVTYKWQWAE